MHVLPRAAIQNPRVNGDAEPAERPVVIAPVAPRRATISLLTSDLDGLRASASKVFAVLLWFHVLVVTAIAYSNHVPVLNVIPIMVVTALIGTFAAWRWKGLVQRLSIAAGLTVGPAMMVYAGLGPWQIDWHMYFFVVFGMLVVYVDWRPIALAAGLTAAHHLVLDLVFPGAVFPEAGFGRVVMHAAIVIVDCAMLFWLVSLMQQLFTQTAASLKAAREATAEAQRLESYAKHGSDLIMQAVNQGLLLCDREYRIQPQYSSELEKIFERTELAGHDLLELLQGLLTERLFRTTSDYFAMLFDPKKKERTVLKVNPLTEVECSFWDRTGHAYASKYLNFSFRRIVENGNVVRVFVAVNDITERVKLERQLSEAEQKKDRQVELLFSLLHIEPSDLDEFIASTKEQVRTMNDTPLVQDFAAASIGNRDTLLTRLDTIFGCVHNIKGNAALIKFEYFQKRANDFESKIVEVRGHSATGGDDFLSVVFAQSELCSDLEELEDLRGKFPRSLQRREIAPSYGEGRARDEVVVAIDEFAKATAEKLGKEVRVDAAGFDTQALTEGQRTAVRDVLVQLTRNSIIHGIESPEQRKAAAKDPRGTLTIRPVKNRPNEFAFTFRDDGRGLDVSLIRDCALARHIIAPERAAAMTAEQIVGLIFEPGFSTASQSTAESGRGIGMNIVRRRILDECDGDIGVLSESGRYCEFEIALPLRVLVPA
jgi:two-component system, chemotaxis family, sensor kinase CheA